MRRVVETAKQREEAKFRDDPLTCMRGQQQVAQQQQFLMAQQQQQMHAMAQHRQLMAQAAQAHFDLREKKNAKNRKRFDSGRNRFDQKVGPPVTGGTELIPRPG